MHPRPFLPFWDGMMLIVIFYSCITSAYFAAIQFDYCNPLIFWLENVCTLFFFFDIIFNFIRIPEDKVNQKVTHMELFKLYNKNGRFFLDVLATVPIYLWQYSMYCDMEGQAGNDDSSFGVLFKLVRLVRLQRLLHRTVLRFGHIAVRYTTSDGVQRVKPSPRRRRDDAGRRHPERRRTTLSMSRLSAAAKRICDQPIKRIIALPLSSALIPYRPAFAAGSNAP